MRSVMFVELLVAVVSVLRICVGDVYVSPAKENDGQQDCADKLDNCEMFGADACGGQYEAWARENCALTCKFCTGPPTSAPPCVDVLDNCASYETSSCTDPVYSSWAKANCRRTCRLCPKSILDQLDALTTTIPPEECVDKLDCRLYGQSTCSGSYEPWARKNCMNYCGFCKGVSTTPKPCLDSRPNCNQYEKDMCDNPSYKLWVDDNCPQYCGRCPGSGSRMTTKAGSAGQPPMLTPPPLGGGNNNNAFTPPPLIRTPPPLPGKR